jgi:hypothetical protein
MLEVSDGRIGHRHAWWPMDKYDEECRDWAEQRRGLADPHKEAVCGWCGWDGGGGRARRWRVRRGGCKRANSISNGNSTGNGIWRSGEQRC